MRFGLELLEAVAERGRARFHRGDPGCPGDEMIEGGLGRDDCLAIAKAHAAHGSIDFISVVGGQALGLQVQRTHLADDVASHRPVSESGERDQGTSERAGPARDPGDGCFHRRTCGGGGARRHDRHDARLHRGPAFRRQDRPGRRGRRTTVRGCRLLRGPRDQREGDALCIQNPATSRERTLPQIIVPSSGPRRRVVVVGGGCGGLEAARGSARNAVTRWSSSRPRARSAARSCSRPGRHGAGSSPVSPTGSPIESSGWAWTSA